MLTVCASGEMAHGRLRLRQADWFAQQLKELRDGEVLITVERLREARSRQQSRYYFGVVLALISRHSGFSVDELHAWAKARFLPKHLALTNGNGEIVDEYILGGSTKVLTPSEFSDYVEAIRQFAAEQLQVAIPDPDPAYASLK